MKNLRSLLIVLVLAGISIGAFYIIRDKSSGITSEQNIYGIQTTSLTELQKKIVRSFSDGNIPRIAQYFDDEVSISLLGEDDFYTKAEAENILMEFCQTHTPKKFFVKHHGSSPANKYYLIGELTTTTSEKFRVYVSNDEVKIDVVEITIPKKPVVN